MKKTFVLFFQLIFFLSFLAVIGEPFRAVFLRRLKIFSDLDLIQIFILDIYIAGLILYAIAILPLSLFNETIIQSLAVFCVIASFFVHSKDFFQGKNTENARTLLENRDQALDYFLVSAMFIIFLYINIVPLSNLVLGSVHDTSLHSLIVQVMLENHQIPFTLRPYLPEGVMYPQASHVIFASASCVLNYEAAKAVFYVTPLFSSLSVFGAYFLGKKLWNARKFCLILAFVSAFVSQYPLYITWGANPYVVGFPLFLICLGLLFQLIRSNEKKYPTEFLAAGIMFGYVSTIMVSFLQTLIMMTALWLIFLLISKHPNVYHNILGALMAFLVSLLILSPSMLRFFISYQYPGHNIGLPSDFMGYQKQQFYLTQMLQWTFDNLSAHPILSEVILIMLGSLALLFWKTKSRADAKSATLFAGLTFSAATLLSFISFFLPEDLDVISWGHQGIILIIPINILIVVFYVALADFCTTCKINSSLKILGKLLNPHVLLAVVLLSLVTTPFLYYRLLEDPGNVEAAYGVFAVTTMDDYRLMIWIEKNLPDDALILVNRYEAGLFIPSVSHRKVIFPFTGSGLSYSYQRIVNLLQQNILNETVYALMGNYNISYIFIGSEATYWWTKGFRWNPRLFLGNPNFKIIKNFGKAYLFKLQIGNQDTIFLENFAEGSLAESGWMNSSYGDGYENLTLKSKDGKTFLIFNSTRLFDGSSGSFISGIYREIYLGTPSKVTLSFSMNASSGFTQIDDLAFMISDISDNSSVVISMNKNGFFRLCNPNSTVTTGEFAGEFTFDLSMLWQQACNRALPNPFILKIANFDADGITNTVYIDYVRISLGEN